MVGQQVIERRIRAYDVKFGKPYGSMDFHDFMISMTPDVYWTMRVGDTVNFGTTDPISTNGDASTASLSGTVLPSLVISDSQVVKLQNTSRFSTAIGSYVLAPASNDGSFAAAISAVIKPSTVVGSVAAGLYEVIASIHLPTTSSYSRPLLFIGRGSDGKIVVGVSRDTDATPIIFTSQTVVNKDQFVHVAVQTTTIQSGAAHKLYINGVGEAEFTTYFPCQTALTDSGPNRVRLQCTAGGFVKPGTTTVATTGVYLPFQGQIEGVGFWLRRVPDFQSVSQQLYQIGVSQTYIDPLDPLIDTAPLDVVSYDQTYRDRIRDLNPAHYYPLDSPGTIGTTELDQGLSPIGNVNIIYKRTCELLPPAVITDDPFSNSAKMIHSDGPSIHNAGSDVTPLNCGVNPGTRTAMSVAFWLCKNPAKSADFDGMWSISNKNAQPTGLSSEPGGGISFATQGDNFYFMKHDKLSSLFYKTMFPWALVLGDTTTASLHASWNLIVCTVSALGVMKTYVNGEQYVPAQLSTNGQGVLVPTSSELMIGGEPPYDDAPPFGLDHFAIFGRELTQYEISNMYAVGRSGAAYTRTTADGVTPPLLGYLASQDPLPQLLNMADITKYVVDWSVEYDITQTVGSCSMTVKEEIQNPQITPLLPINKYITIEERYATADYGTVDIDWTPIGHFLVDGSPRQTNANDGEVVYQFSLRTVMKLASLDVMTRHIVADRITHTKALLTLSKTVGDTYEFTVQRPAGDVDPIYVNWLSAPMPRLFTSGFLNRNKPPKPDGTPSGTYGPELPGVIRVKDAASSIQILTGQGICRISKTYYENFIPDGLGNPNILGGLRVTFDRYLNSSDVVNTTVSALITDAERGLKLLDFAAKPGIIPQTMFVNSGNAKGRVYKIASTSPVVNLDYISGSAFNAASNVNFGNPQNWIAPGNAIQFGAVNYTQYASCTLNYGDYTNYLVFSALSLPSLVQESYVLRGIVIKVYCECPGGYGKIQACELWDFQSNAPVPGTNQANHTGTNKNGVVFGAPNSKWGTTLINAQNLNRFGISVQMSNPTTPAGNPNDTGRVYKIEISYYIDTPTSSNADKIVVRNVAGFVVNPVYEGIQVGDQVELGSANRPEDVLRQLMYLGGQQNTDSTRPFFFQVNALPVEFGGMQLPPQNYFALEGATVLDAITRAVSFMPPNYSVIPKINGQTIGGLIIQQPTPSQTVESNLDYGIDGTDINVYNKVVGVGETTELVNLAASTISAIRSYKMTNYVDPGSESSPAGITYTPAQMATANAPLLKLLDSNAKTPAPVTVDAHGWHAKDYGVIWQMAGATVGNFTMNDEALFCLDIGRNVDANAEYLLDRIQIGHLQTYLQTDGLTQTMSVWAMIEKDYQAEYGKVPPAIPSQAMCDLAGEIDEVGGTYIPRKDSPSWKLLVDEFKLNTGMNDVQSPQFVQQEATKARFLKFEVNQAHAITVYNKDNRARIDLTEIRVFPSVDIYATATIGITGKFNTPGYKALLGQMRVRRYVLEKNVYINDIETLKNFAVVNLSELVREFSPSSVTAMVRNVLIGDTIAVFSKHTSLYKNYLVRSSRYGSSGIASLGIIDYS